MYLSIYIYIYIYIYTVKLEKIQNTKLNRAREAYVCV